MGVREWVASAASRTMVERIVCRDFSRLSNTTVEKVYS
jgi:hypothetical protein